MDDRASAHSDEGLKGLLSFPWVYRLFGQALGGPRAVRRLIRDHVKPFDGCCVLDIGCGPGNLPAYLPASLGEYCGIDINPRYIHTARERWRGRVDVSFFRQEIAALNPPKTGYYDIVVAIAILHHLDDATARRLFTIAHAALKPGGRLITYDGTCVATQSRLAKWFISMDRGSQVRTPEGYRGLASRHFHDVTGVVLHDTIRVPYTIYCMTCTKGGTHPLSPDEPR